MDLEFQMWTDASGGSSQLWTDVSAQICLPAQDRVGEKEMSTRGFPMHQPHFVGLGDSRDERFLELMVLLMIDINYKPCHCIIYTSTNMPLKSPCEKTPKQMSYIESFDKH